MDEITKAKLREKGHLVTNPSEWLELTPEADLVVQFRVYLTLMLKRHGQAAGMTQSELADRLGTSQSRIAFAEGNDSTVSTDLLLKALGATGVGMKEAVKELAEMAAA